MHRVDNSNFLLYIEPAKEKKSFTPLEDELVEIMDKAMSEAKRGTARYSNLDDDGSDFRENNAYKGTHKTDCGERSSNSEYLLKNGMITNSLAPFYLRWYRGSIPIIEMKKLVALKEFYNNPKSKIEEFAEKSEKVNMDKIMSDARKRNQELQEIYEEELNKESKRIETMQCPCCKSSDKSLFRQTENSGVFGPGFYSNVVSEYYICQGCGVHYTDLNKQEITPPTPSIF